MSKTRILLLALNFFIVPLLTLGLAIFVKGNFDFGNWEPADRLMTVLSGSLIIVMTSIIIIDFKIEDAK